MTIVLEKNSNFSRSRSPIGKYSGPMSVTWVFTLYSTSLPTLRIVHRTWERFTAMIWIVSFQFTWSQKTKRIEFDEIDSNYNTMNIKHTAVVTNIWDNMRIRIETEAVQFIPKSSLVDHSTIWDWWTFPVSTKNGFCINKQKYLRGRWVENVSMWHFGINFIYKIIG